MVHTRRYLLYLCARPLGPPSLIRNSKRKSNKVAFDLLSSPSPSPSSSTSASSRKPTIRPSHGVRGHFVSPAGPFFSTGIPSFLFLSPRQARHFPSYLPTYLRMYCPVLQA